MSEKYNGWTNYETWRVNLEIFDGMELGDFWGFADANPADIEPRELGETLKDYVEELLLMDVSDTSLVASYALAFVNGVNWFEIAQSMIRSYIENEEYENA